MTSIRSFSEILRDDDLAIKDRNRYAGIILDESIRLSRLLDDLLDLSVLENGQVVLRPQTGRLLALLDRAIAAAGLHERNLIILRDRAAEDIEITADLDRLVQVFINLISNAAKYCDAKKPALTIRVSRTKGQHRIDFLDNGIGIAAQNQELIFEKFSRLADESKAGGAGLGLAICREIMHRLQGDIIYLRGTSGTAFRVTLPVMSAPVVS